MDGGKLLGGGIGVGGDDGEECLCEAMRCLELRWSVSRRTSMIAVGEQHEGRLIIHYMFQVELGPLTDTCITAEGIGDTFMQISRIHDGL